MTAIRTFGLIFAAAVLVAPAARSASFGDLSGGDSGSQFMGPGPYAPGPYAAGPYGAPPVYGPGPYAPTPAYGVCPACGFMQPTSGGPEGALPPALDTPGASTMPPRPASPRPYLPFTPNADLPQGQLQLATFGQVNSTTDPFNPWGLSTPFMFVPWSTPLSGWANSQTWNWWRERSGALPRNW